MSQLPLPGWYHDPTTLKRRRYWDGTAWTSATAPPPTRSKRTVVWRRWRQRAVRVQRAIAPHPKVTVGGLVVIALLVVIVTSPHTPTKPAAAAVAPEVVQVVVVVMPNVVGMTGSGGQQAIRTATDSGVFASLVDAVPVGCSKLAMSDAPIVRSDPLADAPLGPAAHAVLFVDRSAGEPCEPPPPSSSPGDIDIHVPDVHDGGGLHRPNFCKRHRYC